MRLLLAALLLSACSRAPEPSSGYEAPDRGFSAQAPLDWRVQEADGGAHRASFFGPAAGPSAFAEAIVVYRYGPGAPPATMEAFVAAKSLEGPPSPPVKASAAGRPALELRWASTLTGPHFPDGRRAMRHHAVLVADGDGYWALVHSWPEGAKPGEDVFKAFVASFRPSPAR